MLAKLNSAWRPADPDADKEMISEEERECFRKIGQKMDSSLLLGKDRVQFPNCFICSFSPIEVRAFVLQIQTFEVTA